MLRGAIRVIPLLVCLAAPPGARAQAGTAPGPASDALVPLPLPPLPPAPHKAARKKAKPTAEAPALLPLPPLPASPPHEPGPAAEPAPSADVLLSLPKVPRKPGGYVLGIYRLVHPEQSGEPSLAQVEGLLRRIAETAPNVKSVSFMAQPPKACDTEDDACFALLGAFQQLDLVVLGSLTKADNGLALQVRLIDVASSHRVAEAQQLVVSKDPLEIESWAEALGCKLLIPDGCTGVVLIDLDLPEMQLVVDGRPMQRAQVAPGAAIGSLERLELPVGPHRIRIAVGQRTSLERTLPVLRQSAAGVALYGRQTAQGGLTLLAPGELPQARDGGPAAPPSAAVGSGERRWTRPVGLATAGLGALAAGFGLYELQHGRGLASDANADYAANGGYYRAADIDKLSAARRANTAGKVATVVGAGLAAAGAFLSFSF